MTVCMGYPAMTPQGRAGKRRRKGAGNPCRENGAPKINVDNLSTLIPFVLRLSSTWHFVKPRWNLVSADFRYLPDYCNTIALWWVTKTVTHHSEVVNWQIVHLPPSHNREGLVSGHSDLQPNNRNTLLCESGGYHFGNHHIPVTTKGGCLWQQNNGNVIIRTPWWNILLTETPVCAESNVNTAARSSTPRPETANIAVSKPAVTRCWIYGKALKNVPNAERIPALAAARSSYRSEQMPNIAAMPVGRKITAIVKQLHTLLFEELDKVCQVPYRRCFYLVKWHFPFWEVPKYRNA